jgi:hypothetical protein
MGKDTYLCINCDQIREVPEEVEGGWVFDSTECRVWPIDGKEHCQTYSFNVCPYCIEKMKTYLSEAELRTLRWLGEQK